MDSLEDQIATALVAKMAGMTLSQIDSQTESFPSSGPATRIDPKSFLTTIHQKQQEIKRKEAEQAHMLAERMHPLPPPFIPPAELPPPAPQPVEAVKVDQKELIDVLKSIDSTLKEFVKFFKEVN